MSTRYIPTKDTTRQKTTKWINGICHYHDIFCECCNPLECTIVQLFKKEPLLKFSTPEKDLIQKCLSTADTDTTLPIGNADMPEEGDLDALFGEPFGEEDDQG